MARTNPIDPLPDAHFGDDYRCCMSCAWNEFRLSRFRGKSDGRRDWCTLRECPLLMVSVAICSEYQPGVRTLVYPTMEFILSLPPDTLCRIDAGADGAPQVIVQVPDVLE